MPIIRRDHFVRARSEREMADASATNIERIIHNKLADLHWAAGNARPDEAAGNGGVV